MRERLDKAMLGSIKLLDASLNYVLCNLILLKQMTEISK